MTYLIKRSDFTYCVRYCTIERSYKEMRMWIKSSQYYITQSFTQNDVRYLIIDQFLHKINNVKGTMNRALVRTKKSELGLNLANII
jgi:hypothetical protein